MSRDCLFVPGSPCLLYGAEMLAKTSESSHAHQRQVDASSAIFHEVVVGAVHQGTLVEPPRNDPEVDAVAL
jgi:hypothetical protein